MGTLVAMDDGTDPVAERVARNESMFRDANERIARLAESFGRDEQLPVLCECANPRCTNVVLVTAAEYADVRREPTWFFADHGHVVNAEGWGRVVSENERYAIVEKLGDAARRAAELSPETEEAT